MPGLARGPMQIDFDGVDFAYEPDRPILKQLAFTIPAGQTIAVVRPFGSRQIDPGPAALPSTT